MNCLFQGSYRTASYALTDIVMHLPMAGPMPFMVIPIMGPLGGPPIVFIMLFIMLFIPFMGFIEGEGTLGLFESMLGVVALVIGYPAGEELTTPPPPALPAPPGPLIPPLAIVILPICRDKAKTTCNNSHF